MELKPPQQRNTRTSSVGDPDRARTSSSAAGNDDTMDNDPGSGSGSTFMVVVPGLFQTLDTLEKAVLPLVNAHPGLTALLVAPPGLPNTHWPAAISLDGKVCFPDAAQTVQATRIGAIRCLKIASKVPVAGGTLRVVCGRKPVQGNCVQC